MKKIEYVASGTSHTRILANSVLENPEVISVINSYFKYLNDRNKHKFSLLFNAFTEKDFGRKFQEHFNKDIYAVHADSGGLQLITQGKTITEELKKQVYTVQANYSDIAMCFDEIPIGVVGERSDRNDTSGRFFDKDNLEHYARMTGINIKNQIEVFLDNKSNAKPIMIAQGNCYDTYMFWIEYIMKEIPASYHQYIGGIAMGAAALGTGPLEDIERAAYATQLPFQMAEPYIHVLGVGSIRRLLPYIALARSGYYPENIHLSYDSTTHTCGASMGLYYLDNGMSINRTFGPDYVKIWNDLNSKFEFDKLGIDVHKFHKMINSSSDFYKNENNEVDSEKMVLYYHNLIGFITGAIDNFTAKIAGCLTSEKQFTKVAHECKISKEMNALLNVKNIDEFKYWFDSHGSRTKSKRIKGNKPATLEHLFS
jgi:hypothetical protein